MGARSGARLAFWALQLYEEPYEILTILASAEYCQRAIP